MVCCIKCKHLEHIEVNEFDGIPIETICYWYCNADDWVMKEEMIDTGECDLYEPLDDDNSERDMQ